MFCNRLLDAAKSCTHSLRLRPCQTEASELKITIRFFNFLDFKLQFKKTPEMIVMLPLFFFPQHDPAQSSCHKRSRGSLWGYIMWDRLSLENRYHGVLPSWNVTTKSAGMKELGAEGTVHFHVHSERHKCRREVWIKNGSPEQSWI